MSDDRAQDGTIYVLQAQAVFRAIRAQALQEHETPGCGHGSPEQLADLAWAGETLLQQAFEALQERPAAPESES